MRERRYRVSEHWYNLRPDARASYLVGQQHLRNWLEWDRGTMNVRDLSIKDASYAHFIASSEWAREEVRLPWLLCVAPDIAQEKRMQRVMHTRLEQTHELVVCTTTEVPLNEHGPRAPIWVVGSPGSAERAAPATVVRQAFSELISLSKAI
jgi:hypothetical protein